MGGRSGQSTGGSSGGGAALGSGVDSSDNYKNVNIFENGNNTTNKSPEYYLGLAGIPKDFTGNARIAYEPPNGKKITVRIQNEGIQMVRTIDTVNKSIYNALFKINENSKFSGKSLQIFTNQVKSAQKEGFKNITVNAAGSPGSPIYNGYYTWAAYGYTPNASNLYVESIKMRTGRDYGTWQNMMKSKQGRADWKANGQPWDGTFDLKKGSTNMKQLSAYTKDKKANS
jgi:hypothetical protein